MIEQLFPHFDVRSYWLGVVIAFTVCAIFFWANRER